MPDVKRVDFDLSQNSYTTKTFIITESIGGIDQPYNMTGHTVRMVISELDDTPVTTLVGTPANGSVSFVFDNTLTSSLATYKFKIEEEINVGEGFGLLVYGDLDIVIYSTTSLDSMIAQELPNIIIPESFKETKVRFWQLFLQNSPSPGIADEDVSDPTAWPELFNYLIAKLVTYDYLNTIIKIAIVNELSSSSGNTDAGGMVKKIETGPTNVEFYDLGSSVSELFKPNAQGMTAIDRLTSDICELAGRLSIHLTMCKARKNTIIIPHKVGRKENPDAITILTKNYPE